VIAMGAMRAPLSGGFRPTVGPSYTAPDFHPNQQFTNTGINNGGDSTAGIPDNQVFRFNSASNRSDSASPSASSRSHWNLNGTTNSSCNHQRWRLLGPTNDANPRRNSGFFPFGQLGYAVNKSGQLVNLPHLQRHQTRTTDPTNATMPSLMDRDPWSWSVSDLTDFFVHRHPGLDPAYGAFKARSR
jgi:hypothetical protein